MKRAAIYIRVSSEKQGEKVSPQAQEDDCRDYCKSRGYDVKGVYRDIEKYRVGSRLVEPSGTRADRPQLKRILADARAGRFDVIIAWREDRLYRSYRPMLDVLDCLDETSLDIELVKETFDKRLAPVKAWAARMELDAKHDRFLMGVRGRLEKGQPWMSVAPYGYDRVDGEFIINETEAHWVRNIFQWYAEGATGREIRQRLVINGAPQRNQNVSHPWALSNLYSLLRTGFYYTGIANIRWGGETYQTTLPLIVDIETGQQAKERKERYRRYPSGNLKAKALAPGKVYCARCNTKMMVISTHCRGHEYLYYRCGTALSVGEHYEGCAGSRRISLLDSEIWNKVWKKVSVPGELERAIQGRIETLRAEDFDAQSECDKLERELETLRLEREKVVTWARKSIITEEDLQSQLLVLSGQETSHLRDLAEKRLLTGNRAERLMKMVVLFREHVTLGRQAINATPAIPEEAEEQFLARRMFIDGLLKRVDVFGDKSTQVQLDIGPDTLSVYEEPGESLRIRHSPSHC